MCAHNQKKNARFSYRPPGDRTFPAVNFLKKVLTTVYSVPPGRSWKRCEVVLLSRLVRWSSGNGPRLGSERSRVRFPDGQFFNLG